MNEGVQPHNVNQVAPDPVGASGLRVAVVIPAYNRSALLARTLASLAQQPDTSAFEVHVCDDGSDEDIRGVVEAVDGLDDPLPLSASRRIRGRSGPESGRSSRQRRHPPIARLGLHRSPGLRRTPSGLARVVGKIGRDRQSFQPSGRDIRRRRALSKPIAAPVRRSPARRRGVSCLRLLEHLAPFDLLP